MDSKITTEKSCFDFKQQLLSMLFVDNIKNPKNHIFKNELDEDPDYYTEKIKYFCRFEWYNLAWYKLAYHYNNNKYGYDSNCIICCVIFAIDKTYTDQKGKLTSQTLFINHKKKFGMK